ncbi:MAG: GNAT family N-acetyltransferase, partial [Deltaproteobacteria bacterium]|nr:GNAT family N-acetyltransferase [Deltaproteobacteria bacterium]
GLTSRGGHKEIMAIGSYARAENDSAEIALMVSEDFQGQGVGSHLLEALEKIARENDYKGFIAHVLKENGGMIHVFEKRYPHLKTKVQDNEVDIQMEFEENGLPQ